MSYMKDLKERPGNRDQWVLLGEVPRRAVRDWSWLPWMDQARRDGYGSTGCEETARLVTGHGKLVNSKGLQNVLHPSLFKIQLLEMKAVLSAWYDMMRDEWQICLTANTLTINSLSCDIKCGRFEKG
eukprot:Skav200197  [mRNA]  locus=scaffold623:84431:84811:+ [translate_table: standard]